MKKYLLKLTALIVLVGTMVGCSEDKVFYNESANTTLGYFVQPTGLLGLTPTVSERFIQVQVTNKSSVARAIKLVIDEEHTTALPSQYTIDQSTLVIPANSYTANIRITSDYYTQSVNNPDLADPTLADQLILTLKLDSIDNTYIDPKKNAFQLTIFNTCDLKLNEIGNKFTATVIRNAYSDKDAMEMPSYEPVMVQGTGDKNNEFAINSLWGPDFVATQTGDDTLSGQYPAKGKIVINPDLSLTIIGDPQTAPWILATSTGVYDTCSNSFRYTLAQSLFGANGAFTVDVTLTPIQ